MNNLDKKIININNIQSMICFIKNISGEYKRIHLDNICLLNINDFNNAILNNKNNLYKSKEILVESNNCKFNIIIKFIKFELDIVLKKEYNNLIFSFDNIDFNKIKIINYENLKIYYNKYVNNIIFTINSNKINKIYELSDIKKEIYDILLYDYVSINDKFNIIVDNDIINLEIININLNLDKTIVYYINNNEYYININNNKENNIYCHDSKNIDIIKSIDIIIISYNNSKLTLDILFGSNNKILQLTKDLIIYELINLNYITVYELYHQIYNKTIGIRLENIKLYNFTNNSNILFKFDYNTQINVINKIENLISYNNKIINNTNQINLCIQDIKNIKLKFEEYGISGLDNQINKIIKEIILPRTNIYSESFKKLIKMPKGAIIYGPSGTGKTTLARNLCKVIGINNITMINGTDILSKWIGEAEKAVRELFIKPKNDCNNLYVIIIDEVDTLFKKRSLEDKTNIVNTFLGEIDGLKEINNIIIIGITNRMDIIDNAILRPGRLNCKIFCGLPDKESRKKIINLYHTKMKDVIKFNKINIDNIVKITNKFSGADIENIYNKIIEIIIENKINNNKEIIITEKIIFNIINKIKQKNKN